MKRGKEGRKEGGRERKEGLREEEDGLANNHTAWQGIASPGTLQ